jgi:hypothetical protein
MTKILFLMNFIAYQSDLRCDADHTTSTDLSHPRERTRPKRGLAWVVGHGVRLIAFIFASVVLGAAFLAAVILLLRV